MITIENIFKDLPKKPQELNNFSTSIINKYNRTMKISVVSGGFDPIHSGHIKYLNAAKGYGEILIVLLNSDEY